MLLITFGPRTYRVARLEAEGLPFPLAIRQSGGIRRRAEDKQCQGGSHNRFALLLGKHHSDMYTFLKELPKEQGDTEVSLTEPALGKKWLELQTRIRSIVFEYDEYKSDNRILEYLRNIGCNVN